MSILKLKYKNGCLSVDFEGMKGFATRSPEALQDFIDQFLEMKLRMKRDARGNIPRADIGSAPSRTKRRKNKIGIEDTQPNATVDGYDHANKRTNWLVECPKTLS